jgi:hypothetical protein
MKFPILSLAGLVMSACGSVVGPSAGAQPHDMSQTGHEQAASRESAEANAHPGQYDSAAMSSQEHCGTLPQGFGVIEPCWTSVANPTVAHRRMAEEHQRAAAEHRAASRALQVAEEQSCVGVAPRDRDVSPFMHAEDIARVHILGAPSAPRGAKIVFRDVQGLTTEGMKRQVDCHLARNASLGFEDKEMSYCPLNLEDVEVRVEEEGGLVAVVVESEHSATAAEIVRRARALHGE